MTYYGRKRSYTGLTASVEDFVAKSEERLLAVMRESIKNTYINASTPTREGGKMRVDTGFLRASGRGSLNGWPTGPSERPKDAVKDQYKFNGEAVDAVIRDMKLGDTFYFGWTANYAGVRELYDGFLEASVQNWSRYVAFATDTVKQRIK